jgi:hypothetical protein
MPSALHRYFFYGWLFRDAQHGSRWERWSALRHNKENSRWLPTYMLRWSFVGLTLFGAGTFVETVLGRPDAAAILYAASVLVVPFNAVTAICWGYLHFNRAGQR